MKKWYSWYSKPRERLWKILPMKFLNFTFKQWNGRYFHMAGVLYFTPEIHEKFVSEEKNEEWPESRNRIIARASPNFCRYDFSFFLSFFSFFFLVFYLVVVSDFIPGSKLASEISKPTFHNSTSPSMILMLFINSRALIFYPSIQESIAW